MTLYRIGIVALGLGLFSLSMGKTLIIGGIIFLILAVLEENNGN